MTETSSRRKLKVYIIESPSSDDIYNEINEGRMMVEILKLTGISYKLFTIIDVEKFKRAFIDIANELIYKPPFVPIIHISAHGNKNCIVLSNGGEISWIKLKELIAPINDLLSGELVICMSSCEGFNASGMAYSSGPPPFYGIIGNCGKPLWGDTAVAFATFYHLLAKGKSVPEAVQAMKVASGNNDFQEIRGEIKREEYQRTVDEWFKKLLEARARYQKK